MRSKLSPSSMIQTQLIDKIDIGNHSISSILIDLIHLLISIDIGNRQKSNSEKMIYRLLSINKIDKKTLSIFIGKSSILIEVTLFFFFDFHRLISEININHRLISITMDTSGMLSSPLGNRRSNCPSAQLPLAEIRRSDDKVFQDFVVGICKGHQNSHLLRGRAFATQQGRDWSYACEFST